MLHNIYILKFVSEPKTKVRKLKEMIVCMSPVYFACQFNDLSPSRYDRQSQLNFHNNE